MNINELSMLIKKSLPKENIKLTAEVRQPKISNGHMYLNLKDNTGLISACIWKCNITNSIKELSDGDNITIRGNLNYYSGRGSLNFIIDKLLEKKGEGDLKVQYKKIMKEFENKGYFLPEKKLKLPERLNKILLLTSKNGAAIEDFYHTLENENCKIDHTLIDVIVQGSDCPSNICKVLNNSDTFKNNYDMIVITRGGGSFEDLFGFCQPELIETVYNLNVPVLSAIGHMVDTTLLDYVADFVAATPSLAGQFIVNHNKKYIDNLTIKNNIILNNLIKNINNKLQILNNYKNKIKSFEFKLVNIKTEYKHKLIQNINNKILQFERILDKYKQTNDIEIYNTKNKLFNSKEDLIIQCEKNKKFILKWGDFVLKIKSYEVI